MARDMRRRSSEFATPPIDDAGRHVPHDARAGLAPYKTVVILNGKGGTVARMGHAAARREIVKAFAVHDIEAEVILVRGKTIARVIGRRTGAREAPAAGPPAIIAAGGDGTVNAVAHVLAGTETPLGILPLGTLNHFARDLGLPLDIAGAAAVIAAGATAAIDVAEVNGQVFVNNSSIGLYPTLVRARERQLRHSRRKKWLAMALALLQVLRRPIARRLTIEAADFVTPCRTPLAFIGNNLYDTTRPAFGRRATLRGGELCLFVAKPRGPLGVVWLLLRAAFGRLDQARDFEQHRLESVTIHSRHRRLTIALDGEILRLRTPLRYRIRPGALRVLVPQEHAT